MYSYTNPSERMTKRLDSGDPTLKHLNNNRWIHDHSVHRRDHRMIDVHAHFTTPSYIEAAKSSGHRQADGMPEWFWPQWTPSHTSN